ncbi:MAG TPA: toll/interleukin-1 receptor domain-containing protein [Clostridia bacterium]|nr:toll/interleukin-1 receptor domain-containing protein [Clostridia bacterium]
MRLLLLEVRDGGHNNAIQRYPESLILNHSAHLIDAQYVDGQYLKRGQDEIETAEISRLLPRGHEYLAQLEQATPQSDLPITDMPTDPYVFISHSTADRDLAAALVDLLRDALSLRPEEIRCSSVDGYRLPSGVNINTQLRTEIERSRTFIALLTPSSVHSTYVLFELGARWGRGAHWSLLVARGLTPGELDEPLRSHNALSAAAESQIDQFVEELSRLLAKPVTTRAAWGAKVHHVSTLADSR